MDYFSSSTDRLIKILADDICCLRCEYCYTPFEKPNRLLKTNADFLINNLIPKDSDRWEIVGGGEPSMPENFIHLKKIIEHVRNHSEKALIIMFTNGVIITKEQLDFLIQNNVRIIISCDFIDSEQRFKKNGESSIIDTVNTIKFLVEQRNIKPVISLVANEFNVKSLEKTLKFYNSLGIRRVIMDVETTYEKDNVTLLKTYRDINFYQLVDDIVKKVKSETNMRFVHETQGAYRISLNQRLFLSYSSLYRIHKNDTRFNHRRLMYRELDKLEYMDRNRNEKFYYNFNFSLNDITYDFLSFDYKKDKGVLRIKMDKPIIEDINVNFKAFLFNSIFFNVKGKIISIVKDEVYNLYYLNIKVEEEIYV